jgi:signal transduction histidine kinase
VRDFGRGTPVNLIQGFGANRRSLGVGLTGMRERINDLGGTFEVQSDTRATTIVVAVRWLNTPTGIPVTRREPKDSQLGIFVRWRIKFMKSAGYD